MALIDQNVLIFRFNLMLDREGHSDIRTKLMALTGQSAPWQRPHQQGHTVHQQQTGPPFPPVLLMSSRFLLTNPRSKPEGGSLLLQPHTVQWPALHLTLPSRDAGTFCSKKAFIARTTASPPPHPGSSPTFFVWLPPCPCHSPQSSQSPPKL